MAINIAVFNVKQISYCSMNVGIPPSLIGNQILTENIEYQNGTLTFIIEWKVFGKSVIRENK